MSNSKTTDSIGFTAPTAGEVELLNLALEALAGNGEWSELQAVMQRRDALLRDVGAGEKAQIYRSTLRSNERVLALLRPVKQAVGEELLALRRRAGVIDRYESNRVSA